MNSLTLLIICSAVLLLAYKFYGDYIVNKIFKMSPSNSVPSDTQRDDVDFIPTKKSVLFGHHFASIAGTGPIVGPAIAVIWGWVPALLWIVLGSIFAGAVHDFGTLIISMRSKGVTVGDLTKDLINSRARIIFFITILFALWIVIAIFGLVIAIIFKMYPQSVFPVWMQIPLALTVGWLSFKKKMNITMLSIVAVILMYICIFIGVHFPLRMPVLFGIDPISMWVALLFIYAFIASVLPVWQLLQPRDYINSHQLIVALSLLVIGVIVAHPDVVAPAIQLSPKGAPPMVPFLFIIVACGAISGFHALVSSGTSSKQINSEADAKFIGYGSMLVEGFLAVMVVIAVTAGVGMYTKGDGGVVLTGVPAWNHYYSSWSAMQGLSAKVTAFVNGAANLLSSIGIPLKYGYGIIGVFVASFAGTTLDTATRIQRYVLSELGASFKIKALENRYISTFLVVLAAVLLAFSQGAGKGALVLWPLFGTSNQLLAGLSLFILSIYLYSKKSNILPTIIPMFFMIFITGWAMLYNITTFFYEGSWALLVISAIILALEIWMIVEGILTLWKRKINP